MTTYPGAAKPLRGGIALVDPESPAVFRIITFQYNPDSLSRSLQVQAYGSEGSADRSQLLRLKAPPVETIKIEIELDASDQLEVGNKTVTSVGLNAQLAALETIIYPTSDQLLQNDQLASSGQLEIVPMESPLALFIWSKKRIVPVRLTDFSITEEAFDPDLNPIRAKVSLGMRVLNVNDLGFGNRAGSLYMLYQQQKESLSALAESEGLRALGIGQIP